MSVLRVGVLINAVLLGFGLSAPTLTIHPKAGDFTWLLEIFSPDELVPTTYSILGVIGQLFEGGDMFLGVILGVFSVVFPVAKLGLYWVVAGCGPELGRASGLLKWTHRAGKFSMAEVFALALMVVVVKTLPGDTTASVEWGAYVFVASVLGTIFVSFALDKSPSST
ncbi:MAG: paraquat-inducible protein A [Opitutales bacterium]